MVGAVITVMLSTQLDGRWPANLLGHNALVSGQGMRGIDSMEVDHLIY